MKILTGNGLRELPGPVLITGHTGFKGTWLTFLLERLRVPVIGLSLDAVSGSLYELSNRANAIEEEFIDVRNNKAVIEFMKKYKPSAIIHMAAQSLVLESYENPRETFETNVMGTANLLQAAFLTKSVKSFLAVTTDKVYLNEDLGRSFVETDSLAGKDPYSASKVGTESVVSAWQQISKVSGGPKVISVRAGNVIGGGDWANDRLLPDIARGFLSKKKVLIRNPLSARPWQHVLDPLVGYLMALESSIGGQDLKSLNFGPDEKSLQVWQVLEIVDKYWGDKISVEILGEIKEITREAVSLNLDSSKALNVLGWKPVWSQEESVLRTLKWWESYATKKISAREACSIDLDLYLSDLDRLGITA
jgi:CDP-glucose 4,6-dehydratase